MLSSRPFQQLSRFFSNCLKMPQMLLDDKRFCDLFFSIQKSSIVLERPPRMSLLVCWCLVCSYQRRLIAALFWMLDLFPAYLEMLMICKWWHASRVQITIYLPVTTTKKRKVKKNFCVFDFIHERHSNPLLHSCNSCRVCLSGSCSLLVLAAGFVNPISKIVALICFRLNSIIEF